MCIDDILIYSKRNKLFTKLWKWEFWLNKVVLLGYVISKDGITLDLSRI